MIRQLVLTFLGLWVVEILLMLAALPMGGAAGTAGATAGMVGGFFGVAGILFVFNLAVSVFWVVGGLTEGLSAARQQRLIEDNLLAGRVCKVCAFGKRGFFGITCRRTDEKVGKDQTCVSFQPK